ncbi:hypothetical protein ACJX0J_027146, partial [Zea mays]
DHHHHPPIEQMLNDDDDNVIPKCEPAYTAHLEIHDIPSHYVIMYVKEDRSKEKGLLYHVLNRFLHLLKMQ